MERDKYSELSHGTMCRGCGCWVGDTQQHDMWHAMQDAMIARIAKDAREGASAASFMRPIGGR